MGEQNVNSIPGVHSKHAARGTQMGVGGRRAARQAPAEDTDSGYHTDPGGSEFDDPYGPDAPHEIDHDPKTQQAG